LGTTDVIISLELSHVRGVATFKHACLQGPGLHHGDEEAEKELVKGHRWHIHAVVVA
jgi:hypothetical protein